MLMAAMSLFRLHAQYANGGNDVPNGCDAVIYEGWLHTRCPMHSHCQPSLGASVYATSWDSRC